MIEVQDIFQQYGQQYIDLYHPPTHVCKAIRAIQNCRTSALGGHTETCDECGFIKISYNSCRNRHCPKCQSLSKERWILAREEDLLPVPYFHVVFSLPEELNMIAFQNQKLVYDLLLKCSQEALKELALNKKFLGADIGCISILHTWGQNLSFHPHVHMIVPSGGLTKDGKWKQTSKKFFVPAKALSKLFRGKFLACLNQAKLKLCGSLEHLNMPFEWRPFIDNLYRKDWYIYIKKPFKTTSSVLKYLGRYTHRVAISNSRIISLHNGVVKFKWRDYRDEKEKIMELPALEFMRRFLLHILPPKFTKIRHYGFLASASKKKKLTLAKKLTKAKFVTRQKLSVQELMLKTTGKDITLCPYCKVGHLSSPTGLSPPAFT